MSVAGVGAWLIASPGQDDAQGKGAAEKEARMLWSLPLEEAQQAPRASGHRGVWVSREQVVKSLPERVVGLDRTTGKQRWEVATPGGHVRCQASTSAGGGVAVLVGGPGEDDCSTAWAVDVHRGKLLWTKKLAENDEDFELDYPARIARSGETAVVEATGRVTTAFHARTGRELWREGASLYGRSDCVGEEHVGGSQLVRKQRCEEESTPASGVPFSVAVVDPASGQERWSQYLGPEGTVAHVLHADPVVVNTPKNYSTARLSIFSREGEIKLERGAEHILKHVDEDGGSSPDLIIRKDVIAAAVTEDDADEDRNKIVAWSPSSGKRLWERETTGYMQKYRPVDTDSKEILALSDGNDHHPVRLVKFSPKSGRPSTVRTYTADTAGGKAGLRPLPYLRDGTLYLTPGTSPQVESDEHVSLMALTAS
ncbi:PQQ-binding-like beta-propeller repeat protein [Streptomyces sulphureus]|uniref:outer membrane protein assembly factor BamB family protein n=1 Tax=Streptomyces sulphureus TaxID=47758 RepID=UPI00131A170C|nr:PQQ-binding-like beta-propeller repeat protein [Streptomyces sulphureus]